MIDIDWHGTCKVLSMKLAVTVWNDRIAPLFDVARSVLIVETIGYGGEVTQLGTAVLPQGTLDDKIALLRSWEIDALICGAISRECEILVLAAGIELDAYVAGAVQEILQAWRLGILRQRRYSMPGCACPRHRCRGRGRGNRKGRRDSGVR